MDINDLAFIQYVLDHPLIIPVDGPIYFPYGAKYTGRRRWWAPDNIHYGVDFLVNNAIVVAAHDGEIVTGSDRDGWGTYIKIIAKGYQTVYAHLFKRLVKHKQTVVAGQEIAISGATGSARLTPPHLHFEERVDIPVPIKLGPMRQVDPTPRFVGNVRYTYFENA